MNFSSPSARLGAGSGVSAFLSRGRSPLRSSSVIASDPPTDSQQPDDRDLRLKTDISSGRGRYVFWTPENHKLFVEIYKQKDWRHKEGAHPKIEWSTERHAACWEFFRHGMEQVTGQPVVICSICEGAAILAHPSGGGGTSSMSRHLRSKPHVKRAKEIISVEKIALAGESCKSGMEIDMLADKQHIGNYLKKQSKLSLNVSLLPYFPSVMPGILLIISSSILLPESPSQQRIFPSTAGQRLIMRSSIALP